MEYRNVKGTKDLFNVEASHFKQVNRVLEEIAESYSFQKFVPPVLEHSEVFVRGVGEGSDVVRKEMYTFLDKGERSLTLRPEFTAGIMRLIVQNKLYATQDLPIKAYYSGEVFRYERPQLGRYRQFNQFGVECVGSTSLYRDVEIIMLCYSMLMSLGLENVTLKINTLGDDASRSNYKEALKAYFANKIENMCEDCKERYNLNPLRILDCKVPEDQEIVKDAPKMSKYLSDESKIRFNMLTACLESLSIPFEVDDTLVRGLDYYSETVFEFHYTSKKGVNYGAIGAGGHYSKLVEEFGGPSLEGIGFSFGLERLVSIMEDDGLFNEEEDNTLIDFAVIPMSEDAKLPSLSIAQDIRMNNLSTEVFLEGGKMGSIIKKAVKKGASFAVIIGDDEMKKGTVQFKNLATQEQSELTVKELFDAIEQMLHHEHHHEDGECCHHHDEEHEHGCCHDKDDEEGEHKHEHECCCHHHKGDNK